MSAPIQARASVQVVPASNWVRSRTLTPERQFGGVIGASMVFSSEVSQRETRSVHTLGLQGPLNGRARHHALEVGGAILRQLHPDPLCSPILDIEQRSVGDG